MRVHMALVGVSPRTGVHVGSTHIAEWQLNDSSQPVHIWAEAK